MSNTVVMKLSDGTEFHLAGWASKIQETVNAARGGGKLIALEKYDIPTGQMVYIDPDAVVSIRDSRY